MARASAKRGGRPRPNAQQRAREEQPVARKPAAKARPEYESQLFFAKIRGRAKWVFAVLAGIFALSFVALGVGTGVSGANLGDVIRDIFGGGGSDAPSVADALDEVASNPDDPDALRDLGNAYVKAGQRRDAANALEQYVALKPDDAEALRQLGNIYTQLYNSEQLRASELLGRGLGQSFASQAFQFPGASGFLGAVGDDPIDESVTLQFQQVASNAGEQATRWQEKRVGVFEKLVAATPDDPFALIELAQAASLAGQTDKAVEAYQKYLDENPDGDYADTARQQIDNLTGVNDTVTG
jgi:tetratricopeptide (TPR) repeat protein